MSDLQREPAIRAGDEISLNKQLVFGLQHLFTMFGATVLVPILTGLNISVALFTAGVGTLFFHWVTKGKVPVFLGSSFAFIAALQLVIKEHGLGAAQGGIIAAGLVYLGVAALVYFVGPGILHRLFPPIVIGPVIAVIGLSLAPVAIKMSTGNWGLAIFSLSIVVSVSMFFKGFFKMVPVLFGLAGGYLAALVFGLVDFTPIQEAAWLAVPPFTWPTFNLAAIAIMAPIAIATAVEHFGDIMAVGTTVENDFVKDPGLHRTLIGDGIATAIAGFFGGPANTTYSENTGVLALTRVWHPVIMRWAAVLAIGIAFVQKIGGFISTIPTAVVGGIAIILFGMIAAIGVRTVVENKVDMSKSRNLIVSSVIFVLGIGGAAFNLGGGVKFEGIGLAAIVGILLNQLLPQE
ncbi:MAG: NCS2 family nucleobase:cation symporter [Firmicutes bacterium]|nr:NCS2 family nucleobase:cation symporter [Dethiobacter sp.]MBS3889681.1 NCS2 family nucleobase:cation symporter [Bacillota bacterium]MBS4053666.1 NCS2 family nucleobase:cation symporter [Thermaerobacter sp.]